MPKYLVIRRFDVNESEMPEVGSRSRRVIEQDYPEIVWEHSHVTVDDEGAVRTFCVYEAPSEEIVREHAALLGQHAIDSIHEIAGDVTPDDFPG